MAGLASLGGKGVFIGKVKRDRLGESFARSLKELGLRFEIPFAEDGPPTACSLIAVTPDGQRGVHRGRWAELEADQPTVLADLIADFVAS